MASGPVWVPEAIQFGVDPESGAVVEQLTSAPVTSTNIYCEQRYASADGARIALSRQPFGQPAELWVADLRSLRLCRVAVGTAVGANMRRNAVYYIAPKGAGTALMRLCLVELTSRELFAFGPDEQPRTGTISPDESCFVGGPYPVRDNLFRLHRLDLASGRVEPCCEIADMFNPHVQFNPADGRQIVVQINRGGQLNLKSGGYRLTGPQGATLCCVDVPTGRVDPLPAGRPHTPPISGHECWAGLTGEVLFTAGQYQVSPSAFVTLQAPPDEERHLPAAAIYGARPGDRQARVVAQGLLYNHLGVSDDGRYFIADDHTTGRVYVGSVTTGKALGLCESHTRQGLCQYSHVHPYMTPDNRFVVFNSIVTGVAQVYAARVPEGFLARLGD